MSRLRGANLLGALACAVSERLEARLKQHPNETDSAAAALNLIGMLEGCSNAALSQALKLSHPATVRLVDRLEAEDLVESRQGKDRRFVALYLTRKGRERVVSVLQDRCMALDGVLDVLNEAERETFEELCSRLLAAMTTSAIEGAHICRLCDDGVCPPGDCPVHQRIIACTAH